MNILSYKSTTLTAIIFTICGMPIQAMESRGESGSTSPRAMSISAVHSDLARKKAIQALQRHIQKNNYKVSHECVTDKVVAQKILESFPHDIARQLFQDFIGQCQQQSFDALSFRYITLIGEPGTGKTTIGHAMGKLIADCQVVEVTAEYFLNTYKNSCRELLNDFFGPFKKAQCPIIIIIDEFDKTVKKTQTKEFSDKDFLHLFMREIDNLPSNILVILTGNDEIDYSSAAFAEDRFKESQFILEGVTDAQRRIAVKRIIEQSQDRIQLNDSEQNLLLSAISSFNLRKIDHLFKVAKAKKRGTKVTYDDCIDAVSSIKSNKKSLWHRLALQFKSNETFRYFVYGVSASALLAGTNLLYQHINYHYFVEPANQARHAESLLQQANQHAASFLQQANQHSASLSLQSEQSAENVARTGGAAAGGVIVGLGAAGLAALIGAKGGAVLGLKIEALTGGASAGIITSTFTIGGGVGGALGYFVGPCIKSKLS